MISTCHFTWKLTQVFVTAKVAISGTEPDQEKLRLCLESSWYLGEKGVEGLAMPTGQSRAGVSGEVPTCG